MHIKIIGIATVLLGFTVYTIWALSQVGYVGLLMNPATTVGDIPIGPLQIAIDLVIMAMITIGWMLADAKKHGITAWPFILITCVLGSIGPLFYLLIRTVLARKIRDQPIEN